MLSLAGKNLSVYVPDFTDSLYMDDFFHFPWQMPLYLVGEAKPFLCSK